MRTLPTPLKHFALAVLAGGLLLVIPAVGVSPSWAQDSSAIILPPQPDGSSARRSGGGGGGIFRIFRFEPQRRTPRQETVITQPQVVLPPPKDPDAITVVTFGDEFADQLREGLVDRFDGDRLIEALGRSEPGSGLTDLTAFDWNIESIRRLDEYDQIGAIAIAIGYSDRRPLVEGERSYPFGSEDWVTAYRNRVTSFALTLATEGYPVIFVGLPPMQDEQLDADVRLINRTIQEAVAPTRARFVSVYAGFSDVEGNYARAGPTMEGSVGNLRREDGIFFNRAGREKYAHFVERFVPREGQEAPEPEVSSVVFEGSTQSDDGVGPVILLTSGFADPTAVLATSPSDVRPEDFSVRRRLLQGAELSVPEGRADNFAWPDQPEG